MTEHTSQSKASRSRGRTGRRPMPRRRRAAANAARRRCQPGHRSAERARCAPRPARRAGATPRPATVAAPDPSACARQMPAAHRASTRELGWLLVLKRGAREHRVGIEHQPSRHIVRDDAANPGRDLVGEPGRLKAGPAQPARRVACDRSGRVHAHCCEPKPGGSGKSLPEGNRPTPPSR